MVESFIVFSRTLMVIRVVPILSYTVFFTSVIHTITVSVQTLIITPWALLIGLPPPAGTSSSSCHGATRVVLFPTRSNNSFPCSEAKGESQFSHFQLYLPLYPSRMPLFLYLKPSLLTVSYCVLLPP